MSDNIKLVIEIPTEMFQEMRDNDLISVETLNASIKAIAHGTPLDDVKAEIEKEENILYHDCEPENGWKKFDVIRVDTVLDILDNIGKENEVKPNE